jgi:PAS domain S-box-containing protein
VKDHIAHTTGHPAGNPSGFKSFSQGPEYSPVSRTASQLMARAGAILWQADIVRRRFAYIGPQAEPLFGFPLSRWLEHRFWERHLHPDDRPHVLQQTESRSKENSGYEMEYRLVATNGQAVWVHDIVLITGKPGEGRRLHGIMLDRTDQKEAERQLHELSGRLISAQEAERRRIARELHDETSQRLALLAVRLELLHQMSADSSERWLAKLTEVSDEVKGISHEIHALCYRLHPAKLEQLGLVTCLKRLCRELADQKRCEITVTVPNVPVHLPEQISLCLYRLAQEALCNALKHSGARGIRVELTQDEDTIRLSVSDNGHGFVSASQAGHHGLGLIGMRERLRLVHGRLSVHTSSRGVHIKAEIPLRTTKIGDVPNCP